MNEVVKVVARRIREENPLSALNYVVENAPDEIKEKAKLIFDDPKVIEEIGGEWGDILALIYYAHISRYASSVMTKQGIAGQVVSSLTAAKISRKLNTPELEAMFLLSGGKALSLMGMRDRAEICYLKAEELLRKLVKEDRGFLKELSDVLNDLGIIYVESGDKEKGQKLLEEALEIRRELGKSEENLPMLAQTLNNLASLYKDLRLYDKSDELFEEAERIYRDLVKKDENYYVDLAVVLCNYGALYRVIKEHEKSEKLYLEALEIFKKLVEKNEFYKHCCFSGTDIKLLSKMGFLISNQ